MKITYTFIMADTPKSSVLNWIKSHNAPVVEREIVTVEIEEPFTEMQFYNFLKRVNQVRALKETK